jgi:hypothetical protein
MNRFEKMAVANAAGITDMAEANKLFGGGLSAFRQAQKDMENLTYTQEELEEAMKASTDMVTKLRNLFNQLAIAAQPIVEVISDIVTKLTEFVAEHKEAIKIALMFIAGVKSLTLTFNLMTGYSRCKKSHLDFQSDDWCRSSFQSSKIGWNLA